MGRWSRYVFCAVLAGFLSVSLGLGSACVAQFRQPFPFDTSDGEGTEAQADFDRDLMKAMDRARELIERNDFVGGINILQRAIVDRNAADGVGAAAESSQDYFVDQQLQQSFKALAREMLGRLPPEGRKAYELQYGAFAKKLLQEALEARDRNRLQAVAREYFHSEAGYEAAYRLGVSLLDQGQPVAALLQFQQLLEYPQSVQHLEPMLSLRAAFCWAQLGEEDEARKLVDRARKGAGQDRIVLGGRQVAFPSENENAAVWLARLLGDGSPGGGDVLQSDWMMVGGDPSRTGRSVDAVAAWDSAWVHNTIVQPYAAPEKMQEIEQALLSLTAERRQRGALTFPAAVPLVVGNRVIYKSLGTLQVLDLETGELVGYPAPVMVDPTLQAFIENPQVGAPQFGGTGVEGSAPLLDVFLTRRIWQDATSATLSSDGVRIFSVEECGLVGPTLLVSRGLRGGSSALAANDYNKLMAFRMSGQLLWEVGGAKQDSSLPLAGAFFLGPPLPLNGALYCLAEMNQEIRLLVLDPANGGKLLWSQSLILDSLGTLTSVRRHLSGVSPSYANGILVCPTLAGVTIGIDLSRRELLWGYRYTPELPFDPSDRSQLWRRQSLGQAPDLENHFWIDSNPLIVGNHVVLTPRDSDEMHCLSLLDGSLRWKRPRNEWLYATSIGEGRLLLVGRSELLAVNLEDGGDAWRQPASVELIAGRGVQMGSLFHVPLATNEIVTISLADGRLVARVPARGDDELGTLVAAQGTMVSLSSSRAAGFLPLAQLEERIADRLAADPNDPGALALRGEIRLQRGEEQAALDDLRKAVELGDDDRARQLIVLALLEGLRTDFAAYQKHTPEIERLLREPEQRSRFHRLYADGLHQVGEYTAAFSEYVKLAGPDTGEPRMNRTSAALAVRSDRWLRPRVGEIFASAEPDDRRLMERLLDEQLQRALDANDPQALRKFIQCFSDLAIADRARRELVERLTPQTDAVEMEILLSTLRGSSDRSTQAYATARLARLLLDLNRGEHVESLLKTLSGSYAEIACLDGKTGRELAEEWRADGEISKILAQQPIWPDKELEAKETASNRVVERLYPIEILGPRGMFPSGWTLALTMPKTEIIARDDQGTKRWQLRLQAPGSGGAGRRVDNHLGNYARVRGHLLILSLGRYFAVVDTLTPGASPRILWERELSPGNAPTQPRQVIGALNGRRIVLHDPNHNELGAVAPIGDDMLCYQVERTLYAADLRTGDILWERQAYPHASEFYGDARHVFVKPANSNQIVILRASDGEQVGVSPVDKTGAHLHADQDRLLVWRDARGAAELALLNLLNGETVWSRTFPIRTHITVIDGEEIALLSPGVQRGGDEPEAGRFVVLRIADGHAVVDSPIEPEPAVSHILVQRDRKQYTALTYRPHDAQNNAQIIPIQNFPLVNGFAYGFDRETGRKLWTTRIERQSVDMDQPQNLPVMVFGVQVFVHNGFRFSRGETRLTVLDKRTGRLVYDEQTKDPLHPMEFEAHPEQGRLEVRFSRLTVSLTATDRKIKQATAQAKSAGASSGE